MAVGDKKPAIMRDDVGKLVPHAIHAKQHAIGKSDPITPDMIGAVSASNGIIDVSDLDNIKAPGHYLFVDNTGSFGFVGALYDLEVSNQLYDNHESIVQRATRTYGADIPAVFERVYYYANTNYWTPWKELATTDYAVNKAGDTMTGCLANTSDNSDGVGCFYGTQYGAYLISYYGDATKQRQLAVCNSNNIPNFRYSLQYVDVETGSNETILHTGNKPSGSYTGNGDATARTIDTGGIGDVVLVSSVNGTALVTPSGGFTLQNGVIGSLDYEEAHIHSGVMTVATVSPYLNANGVAYNYQVL